MILIQSSSATITADQIHDHDDVLAAADLVWQLNKTAGPDGVRSNDTRVAWFSVVAGAAAYGDILLGMRVNGGALCGVVAARPEPGSPDRMILSAACSAFDAERTLPKLIDAAKTEAERRGRKLFRRRSVMQFEYQAV